YGAKVTNNGTKPLGGDVMLVATPTAVTKEQIAAAAAADKSSGNTAEMTKLMSKYFRTSVGNAYLEDGKSGSLALTVKGYAEVNLMPGSTDGSPITDGNKEPWSTNRLSAAAAKTLAATDTDVTFASQDDADPKNDVGTYKANLWAYDSSDGTIYDVKPIALSIVDEGIVATSLKKTWDLNAVTDPFDTHKIWIVNINDFGKYNENTASVTLTGGTIAGKDVTFNTPIVLTAGTDYAWSQSGTSGFTFDVTLSTTQIEALGAKALAAAKVADAVKFPEGTALKSGDKLTMSLKMNADDSNLNPNADKAMILNYIDTTPKIAIALTATPVVGQPISGTVTVTKQDGGLETTPTYTNDALVNWYRVPAKTKVPAGTTETDLVKTYGGVKVQGSGATVTENSPTYTVTGADSGAQLYVAIAGEGGYYRGANIAGPAVVGIVVTAVADPALVGNVTSDPAGDVSGNITPEADGKIKLTAPTKDGYLFTGWTAVETHNGTSTPTGKFTTDAAGTITTDATTTGTVYFWATTDSAVTAHFILRPTLTPNRTYDLYKNGGDTLPKFA
ncbi:MAG: hypothetical protein RSB55_08845, partial [Oscillospiraceae bacterium]